jgi:uncharacterized protein YutE (UPF0331/DUF86 family)
VTQSEHLALLAETLSRLDEAERWLRRSYARCNQIDLGAPLSDLEYDAFENLTSRFARASDMVLQKVFRSIDHLELEEGGTLLDVLNRAEKRGLVASADQFRELRELRNEIAHEYALDDLRTLFASALEHTPALLDILGKIREYCQKYLGEPPPASPSG